MCHRLVFLFSIILSTVAQSDALENDLPGCGCNATSCASSLGNFTLHGNYVCNIFDAQYGNITDVKNITSQEAPVCDAIEAHPTFRNSEYFVKKSRVSDYVSLGTCSETYARQMTCDTNYNPDLIAGISHYPKPGRCTSYTAKKNYRNFHITSSCRSTWDSNLATNDVVEFYVETDGEVAHSPHPSMCRSNSFAKYTPVLTSKDWIEARTGFRYMCHDFSDGFVSYNIMILSIGKEPCGDPVTKSTGAPTGAPTVSSTNDAIIPLLWKPLSCTVSIIILLFLVV